MSKLLRKFNRLNDKKKGKLVIYKYDSDGKPVYLTEKQIKKLEAMK